MKEQDIPNVLNEYQREGLIINNLHLVNVVASKYRFLDCNKYDDIIQEGRIGLIKAVDKFNKNLCKSFKFYAINQIRYSIQDFLKKDSNLLHIPSNRLSNAYRLFRHNNFFVQKNSALPSFQELAGHFNYTDSYLKDILYICDLLSNKMVSVEESHELYETNLLKKILSKEIFSFLKKCSEKEQFIICQKYKENRSFRKISKELNISHESVRSIHDSVLKKLRIFLKIQR